MKKKALVLPAMAMLALTAWADNPALLIHTGNGTTPVPLAEITKMKPDGEGLKIVTAGGEQTFDYADIVNLTFDLEGSWVGIMEVEGAETEVSLSWNGRTSTATVTGLAAGTQVNVYDTAGRNAAALLLPEDGAIDLSSLNSGIYIINIHNKSFKIAKR
mgnify:CR=1 FL=1